MAFLRAIWNSLPFSRPRESVELKPVEQLALRYLLQYGPHTADDIRQEVSGTRIMVEKELEEGLAHLVETELVEASIPIVSDTQYSASKKAAILRDRIPLEPRGVTEFYL
jgi:hypothetical protein